MDMIDLSKFNISFSESPSPTQCKHLTQSFFALEKTCGVIGGSLEILNGADSRIRTDGLQCHKLAL